jgi:hypothetical protein
MVIALVGNAAIANELLAGPMSLCAAITLHAAYTTASHLRLLSFSSARHGPKHIGREPPFLPRGL